RSTVEWDQEEGRRVNAVRSIEMILCTARQSEHPFAEPERATCLKLFVRLGTSGTTPALVERAMARAIAGIGSSGDFDEAQRRAILARARSVSSCWLQ